MFAPQPRLYQTYPSTVFASHAHTDTSFGQRDTQWMLSSYVIFGHIFIQKENNIERTLYLCFWLTSIGWDVAHTHT